MKHHKLQDGVTSECNRSWQLFTGTDTKTDVLQIESLLLAIVMHRATKQGWESGRTNIFISTSWM